MCRCSPFIFFAVLILFAGCVTIPANHFTVEQDGFTCSVTADCHCEKIDLQTSYLDPATAENGLDPERIILLNWNVQKETGHRWVQELSRFIRDVDLLTLQEGALTDELRELLSGDYAGGWTLASAFTKSNIHTGILTASKVKPDFSCSFRIDEPIIVVPKTVLITRYPIATTNLSLLLVNLHLVNFSFTNKTYREQLQKVLDLIKYHKGPLLISGDFNSWSSERMDIVREFASELGAEPVKFSEDHRSIFFGHILDYVYYRKLEPIEAVTLKVKTSDHNPMRITFRLAENRFVWSEEND